MLVTCSKFHQHFTSSFLPISLWQKNYNVKLWEEKKLRKALEYKKGEREMLMKLMPESGNRKREVSRTINLPKSLRNRIIQKKNCSCQQRPYLNQFFRILTVQWYFNLLWSELSLPECFVNKSNCKILRMVRHIY